jgi:hypothetical protein
MTVGEVSLGVNSGLEGLRPSGRAPLSKKQTKIDGNHAFPWRLTVSNRFTLFLGTLFQGIHGKSNVSPQGAIWLRLLATESLTFRLSVDDFRRANHDGKRWGSLYIGPPFRRCCSGIQESNLANQKYGNLGREKLRMGLAALTTKSDKFSRLTPDAPGRAEVQLDLALSESMSPRLQPSCGHRLSRVPAVPKPTHQSPA